MLCAGMNTYLRITRLWGVVTDEAGQGGKAKLQRAWSESLTTAD